MLEYYFDCPHCLQNQLKMIDPSIINQQYIEDCETYYNPLEFIISVNENLSASLYVSSTNQYMAFY